MIAFIDDRRKHLGSIRGKPVGAASARTKLGCSRVRVNVIGCLQPEPLRRDLAQQ
jgi:hypothetical protein